MSSAAAETPRPSLTASGLPRRRRVTAAADEAAPGGGDVVNREPERPAEADWSGEAGRPARQTAAGLGAWQRGTRSGRATVPPESEGKSQA